MTVGRLPDLHVNALGLISGMFYTSKFDKIGMFLPESKETINLLVNYLRKF